jgi:hypothetical protein
MRMNDRPGSPVGDGTKRGFRVTQPWVHALRCNVPSWRPNYGRKAVDPSHSRIASKMLPAEKEISGRDVKDVGCFEAFGALLAWPQNGPHEALIRVGV